MIHAGVYGEQHRPALARDRLVELFQRAEGLAVVAGVEDSDVVAAKIDLADDVGNRLEIQVPAWSWQFAAEAGFPMA
jgi:hypothetical protein